MNITETMQQVKTAMLARFEKARALDQRPSVGQDFLDVAGINEKGAATKATGVTLTEKGLQFAFDKGIFTDQNFALFLNLPQKGIKRTAELLSVLTGSNAKAKLDSVTVAGLFALAIVGKATSETLLFAATKKGNEHTTDAIKGKVESFKRLHKFIGQVGSTTAPTQLSRSFGKNGFCSFFGITQETRESNTLYFALTETGAEHPLFVAVNEYVRDASDGKLDMVARKVKGAE